MSHSIRMNGRLVSPAQAAKNKLPLDTELVCPECSSTHVAAAEPRTTARIGHEYPDGIPRMQDRRCLACDHRWACVLPPMTYQFNAVE